MALLAPWHTPVLVPMRFIRGGELCLFSEYLSFDLQRIFYCQMALL